MEATGYLRTSINVVRPDVPVEEDVAVTIHHHITRSGCGGLAHGKKCHESRRGRKTSEAHVGGGWEDFEKAMVIRTRCQQDDLYTRHQRYLGGYDLVAPNVQALGVFKPV
jgi:hypothetical protein